MIRRLSVVVNVRRVITKLQASRPRLDPYTFALTAWSATVSIDPAVFVWMRGGRSFFTVVTVAVFGSSQLLSLSSLSIAVLYIAGISVLSKFLSPPHSSYQPLAPRCGRHCKVNRLSRSVLGLHSDPYYLRIMTKTETDG